MKCHSKGGVPCIVRYSIQKCWAPACSPPLLTPSGQARLTDETVRVLGGWGTWPGSSACRQPSWHPQLGWVLGDSRGLSQHSTLLPQLLTWPDTSPPQHSAGSTGGLSAHKWMLAHSWGLGPSQGDLEWAVGEKGAREEEHDIESVRLATANAQRPPHTPNILSYPKTLCHSPWALGPGPRCGVREVRQQELTSRALWCGSC